MSAPYSKDDFSSVSERSDMPLDSSGSSYDDANKYSRSNYGRGAHAASRPSARKPQTSPSLPSDAANHITASEIYPEIARLRRRKKRRRRVVAVILCLLLAVVGAGSAYAVWFIDQIDSALAPDEISQNAIKEVLASEAPYEPFYVLLLGSDSREGNEASHRDEKGDNERSDVMILARIDAANRQITLLSIPRDTPYQLEDGSYIKINEMLNVKGTAGAVKAVSELTGLPISHYAQVRISGLEAIVDLIGGVTVDVPTELSYKTTDKERITIPEGRQTLNGREAQIFARARHEFVEDQDEHRQSNVRQLLEAIIKKTLDRPISEIPSIALQIANYVDTDYKALDLIAIARTFSGGDMTIYSATGPSNGDNNSGAHNKWMCYLNPEGWSKAVEVMRAGEDPSGIAYEETEIPWTEVYDQPEWSTSLAREYYYG